jgi:hypothetical protein
MFQKAIICIFFCCLITISAIPQTPSQGAQARQSPAGATNATESAQNQPSGTRKDDAQALRQDIARMRAIVQQMQENLAFVDNTQSPLKHQFQLEIDAWTVLLNQMERRAQTSSH